MKEPEAESGCISDWSLKIFMAKDEDKNGLSQSCWVPVSCLGVGEELALHRDHGNEVMPHASQLLFPSGARGPGPWRGLRGAPAHGQHVTTQVTDADRRGTVPSVLALSQVTGGAWASIWKKSHRHSSLFLGRHCPHSPVQSPVKLAGNGGRTRGRALSQSTSVQVPPLPGR